ncbi:19322_t:CDS:1, partial [Gigaspora rosea]
EEVGLLYWNNHLLRMEYYLSGGLFLKSMRRPVPIVPQANP